MPDHAERDDEGHHAQAANDEAIDAAGESADGNRQARRDKN